MITDGELIAAIEKTAITDDSIFTDTDTSGLVDPQADVEIARSGQIHACGPVDGTAKPMTWYPSAEVE